MAWTFRKRVKIIPVLHINSGISISILEMAISNFHTIENNQIFSNELF